MENFKWTDELVAEFHNWIPKQSSCSYIDYSSLINCFKQLKEPKKDYEILTIAPLKQDAIYSVRRLSDGGVFTIKEDTNHGFIGKFEIIRDGMYAYCHRGTFNINELTKVKKPLFTTEDGKPILFMDLYFSVTDNWEIRMSNATQKINYANRTFSTKEAAEEYVIMNKPCLSLRDVIKHCNEQDKMPDNNPFKESLKQLRILKIYELKELVKSKL